MDYDFCRGVDFVQMEIANDSENKRYGWRCMQWVRKSFYCKSKIRSIVANYNQGKFDIDLNFS